MENRFKLLKTNSIIAIGYQFLLIACGFLLPKCILRFYGSETNGLLSSVAQFLAFINICDMGISTVVASAYYKPLAEKNTTLISQIFNYSKKFYRTIGIIFLVYIFLLLVLLPSAISSEHSPFFIVGLILSMSISQFAQYFIGNSHQVLLNADQRSYVQLGINGITLFISTLLSIVLMFLGSSIQVVKLCSAIIYLLRPLAMMFYVRTHYSINRHILPTADAVPQKANGIIQHISYTIYENTDIIILTFCSSLSNVSIYSIYSLVLSSIRNIIISSISGFQALFGNMIAKKEFALLQNSFSFYNWLINSLSSYFFTVAGILILPFVTVYTANVHDVEYRVPLFAFILTLAFGIGCIRNGLYNLIRAAGHYKQSQHAALAEAFINLVLSFIFVVRFGLVGVAVATLISAIFFTAYETVYLSKKIVKWPMKNFLTQYGLDAVSVFAMLFLSKWIFISDENIFAWLISAVQISVYCFIVFLLVHLVFRFKHTKKAIQVIWAFLISKRTQQ